ncbi:MAG: hypothetical protein IT371_27990 [Deltaproteobacteria bacterium]|nr:hypothetical protein [Deltaproteobacteria bacterium]
MGAAPRESRGRGDARCRPTLPQGYDAQPAFGFSDATGRYSYEFNRVYGPMDSSGGRGPIARLDEDRSYWAVGWSTFEGTEEERPMGRWLTYAQARKLPGPRLTFERFSSVWTMCDRLPALMKVEDQAGSDAGGARSWTVRS